LIIRKEKTKSLFATFLTSIVASSFRFVTQRFPLIREFWKMALVVYQGGAESSQDGSFTDYYGNGNSSTPTSTTAAEGVKRFVGLANQGATW
jgi:hypothetical protein